MKFLHDHATGFLLLSSTVFLLSCQGEGNESVTNDETGSETEITSDNASAQSESCVETKEPFCAESVCDASISTLSNCTAYTTEFFNTVQNHKYLTSAWQKINAAGAYPTELAVDTYINVYVNQEGAEDFSVIDPEISHSDIEVASGTTIIREVWNSDQELEKYTVMIKMETGYYPEGGDFAYIVMGLDGTIEQGGKIDACAVCHESRAFDGYLFGVPNEVKQDPDIGTKLLTMAKEIISGKSYYQTPGFRKVNLTSYEFALDTDKNIDIYVQDRGLVNYLEANPDDDTPVTIQVPQETAIVMEVRDSSGEISAYDVMIKGPMGYFEEGGDFYYAAFDSDGVLKVDDGEELEGKIELCGSCHRGQRAEMGYIFGVTPDLRDPTLN